jgi:hypothetical protein
VTCKGSHLALETQKDQDSSSVFSSKLYTHSLHHYYHLKFPAMAASNPIIVSKSLTTISLDRLRAGDDAESKKLLSACQGQGFFYLDLSSDPELCELWEGMLARMKDYFGQPLDVKMQDARNSDNYG